jgi:transcription initiation factor TFIIB
VTTDAYGNEFDASKQRLYGRLAQRHERSQATTSWEQSLRDGLGELRRMASTLELPQPVTAQACQLFHRVAKNDLLYGRSIDAATTAVLYIATRQLGVPRTVAELCPASHADQKDVFSNYRYIASELSINLDPVDPTQFLPRLLSQHEVDTHTRRIAKQLLTSGKDHVQYAGKNPMCIAAGALYAAATLAEPDEHPTQEAIAETAEISSLTLRHRAYDFLDQTDEILPPELNKTTS